MSASSATRTGVVCPLCGWEAAEFLPQGLHARANARCGGCGSLERHRALYLYLRDQTEVFEEPTRLLHFAPESGLRSAIERAGVADYVTTDLEMEDVSLRMEISDLLFKDGVFDCVICSHVLEHVDDDRKALREIRRVLRPDGFALILVPSHLLSNPETIEDPSIVTAEERERAFGQRDHVRIYGRDLLDRLEQSGFLVDIVAPGREFDADEATQFGVLSTEKMFVCRPREAARLAESGSAVPRPRRGQVDFATEIAPHDAMLRLESPDLYFRVGLQALRLVEDALCDLGRDQPQRILDLPSGFGQVLRMLSWRFPETAITACDVDPRGVEFCASEFGARAVVAPREPADLELPENYDLAWCGSLFTHLPEDAATALLNLLAHHLEPGGVLVLTTYGDKIEKLLVGGRMTIPVDDEGRRALLERYREEGFAFEPYDVDTTGGYGVALSSEGWFSDRVAAIEGLDMISHIPHGWDRRQDVIVCQSSLA